MRRVVSLFLPDLAVERLRRRERSAQRPPEPAVLVLPVDEDPGPCSVPRGGDWRPGARWARKGSPSRSREDVDADVASLPAHARPPMRELGRRSEAAPHPYRTTPSTTRTGGPRDASSDGTPLALFGRVGHREAVVAACRAARSLGIEVGMAATHARALVSDLDLRPSDPVGDAALLDRLALLAVRRWSPIVMATPNDGLWIDLTGCAHLHGGEQRFCRRLIAFCGRAGFTARVAVADTPAAAFALARYAATDLVCAEPGNVADAIAPLPVAALRLSPSAVAAARRFGFDRIADLLPVARGPLARRLGLPAIVRLDQALGAVAEPLVPHRDAETPRVERRLLEPILTAEAIEQVMGDLLHDMADVLRARGLGARSLRLTCLVVDGSERIVGIGTSRPTREAPHLLRLFKLRIEMIDPGMGIERFVMSAPHAEPLDAIDLGGVLAGDERASDPSRLVDVIAGRIGAGSVFRLAPVENHVPERAVARSDPNGPSGDWPVWPRPIRLFGRPEPLSNVIALMPDHPPRRFEWRGRTYDVVAGDGPERVHGEWWRRDAEVWAVRDYYRIEDREGGRYWVFRRGDGVEDATGDLSWWMHGVFG